MHSIENDLFIDTDPNIDLDDLINSIWHSF